MKQDRSWPKDLPVLLIQQIRLQWYKNCRGGSAATRRNQYPRAMELPKDFFAYYSFGLPIHFVSVVQSPDGFRVYKDCRRLLRPHLLNILRPKAYFPKVHHLLTKEN